jgi:DNA-binding HxlR family transcriptional regulator
MSRADLSLQSCSIARAVAQVGDEWTIMILREMFLGTRRFDDFLRQTRMSSHLLAGRLKKLEALGVIRREAYSEHPPRSEYRLTAMGRDLWPVIIALKQWGDRWLGDGDAPVQIVHKGCGHLTQPQMTCPDCGQAMEAYDARAELTQSYEHERQAARRHT